MSWRFRKTFKVLPGVKLNLTSRGLSATIGAAPLSVNVGPHGVYRNVSIPGTGIWDRQRLGTPAALNPGVPPSPSHQPISHLPPPIPDSTSATHGEIHSASTELLTSDSLEQLRSVLKEAYDERSDITKEISAATFEANTAKSRYDKWHSGFLLKHCFKRAFVVRKEVADTCDEKLEELKEQLRLTTLATEISLDQAQAEPYYRMRDAFAILTESEKIWNVLTEQGIDRIAERSSADTVITRDPVSFSLNSCDLIQWEQKVPHLPNRTGGDMYIFPGFLLYRASKQAFALIDSREVTLTFVSTRFTETLSVPSDTEIVGQTWAKCNKDGSPDRRFRDNYQIPLAHYGTLLFSSNDGLDVRYVCSNPKSAEAFVKAWSGFRLSFNGVPQTQKSGDYTSVEIWQQAVERFRIASEVFQVANKNFSNTVLAAARAHIQDSMCKLTMSEDDFTAYAASVVELIAAAKDLEERVDLASGSANRTFRGAIHNLEKMWTSFSQVTEGRINGSGFEPFLHAVAAFYEAQSQFFAANSAALQKRNRRHQ